MPAVYSRSCGSNKLKFLGEVNYEKPVLHSDNGVWNWPPVIIRSDDEAAPGKSFMIYGEGLTENSKVYAERIETNQMPAAPAKPTELSVLSADADGRNLTCFFPKDLDGGSYNIWAENEHGLSLPEIINAARGQWVSSDTVYDGMEFSIFGKNLSPSSFGAKTHAGVYLKNESGAYNVPIKKISPYEITCKMKNVPAGEYRVYVSNDGIIWKENEDKKKITVLGDVYDPYELNVGWAGEFKWDNVYRASAYGINTDADAHLTTVNLQNLINSVSAAGGGVICLDGGSFNVNGMFLKSNVVIAGIGMKKTVLNYLGGGEAVFDARTSDRVGIVDLTIKIDASISAPETVVGMGIGDTAAKNRTGEYYFMKRVEIDSVLKSGEDKNEAAVNMCGKGHVLLEDCDFKGHKTSINANYATEYVEVRGNRFETVCGALYLWSQYSVVRDNTIIRRSDLNTNNHTSQGIILRGFSHVEGNIIKDAGMPRQNDGEVVCTEPYRGGTLLHGNIVGATENSVTLSPKGGSAYNDGTIDDIDISGYVYSPYYLVITGGRGLGQYAIITDWNPETKTVTLDRDFTVLPDDSSCFAFAQMVVNTTVYKNSAYGCGSTYNFYGDSIDCVMTENTGDDTRGIGVYSFHRRNGNETGIAYFTKIKGNTFTGESPRSGTCSIFAYALVQQENITPYTIGIYGFSAEDNVIHDVDKNAPCNYADIVTVNGICINYCVDRRQTELSKVIKGVIIQNNTVKNTDKGISITPFGNPRGSNVSYAKGDMTDNIYIGSNTFENVEKEFTDRRSWSVDG